MIGLWFVGFAMLGAVTRWQLARINRHGWPGGTLVANVLASFLIGALVSSSSTAVTLLGIGFCGSVSTFSTLIVELYDSATRQDWRAATAYLSATLVLGIGAAWLGFTLVS